MKSIQLACASTLCFLSLACGAVDTTQKTPVPDGVSSFVGPTDVLLAYQKLDLFGNGSTDAVIILRHQKSAAPAPEENPCDLLILEGKAGKFSLLEKTNKVVDCTYNEDAKFGIKATSDYLHQSTHGWLRRLHLQLLKREKIMVSVAGDQYVFRG
jgi:hypothetical protein